jgi:hypothetical protein
MLEEFGARVTVDRAKLIAAVVRDELFAVGEL